MKIKIYLPVLLLLCFYLQQLVLAASTSTLNYGPINISLTTTSTLNGSKSTTYNPENMLDGDLNTAWIEGQKGDYGARITFNFSEGVVLCGFEYIPGYTKTKETYRNNVVPLGFAVIVNREKFEINTFVKTILTGYDPEVDEKPAYEPDFNDPENYTYQYTIFNPTMTNRAEVVLGGGMPAKYQDCGFTELHPIYIYNNQLYCGKELAGEPLLSLTGNINKAKFSRKVWLPTKKYINDGLHPSDIYRFAKNDVLEVSTSKLSLEQKRLFFPFNESFRIYSSGHLKRVTSQVGYGFWECDTPCGILTRNVYLEYETGGWKFKRVEYQDELWKLPTENKIKTYFGYYCVYKNVYRIPMPKEKPLFNKAYFDDVIIQEDWRKYSNSEPGKLVFGLLNQQADKNKEIKIHFKEPQLFVPGLLADCIFFEENFFDLSKLDIRPYVGKSIQKSKEYYANYYHGKLTSIDRFFHNDNCDSSDCICERESFERFYYDNVGRLVSIEYDCDEGMAYDQAFIWWKKGTIVRVLRVSVEEAEEDFEITMTVYK